MKKGHGKKDSGNAHKAYCFDSYHKYHKKTYPPTTIEPSELPEYTHLKQHQINKTICRFNEVIFIMLKQKIKFDEVFIVPLLRYFNINAPKQSTGNLDPIECKKPDFLNVVNLCILQRLYKDIN